MRPSLYCHSKILGAFHVCSERLLARMETKIVINKTVYTAISVACGWAGAVMSLCKPQTVKKVKKS